MSKEDCWETLLHHAALLPVEKRDEAPIKIMEWKRIAARPFPSVRTHGLIENWKRRWEESIK